MAALVALQNVSRPRITAADRKEQQRARGEHWPANRLRALLRDNRICQHPDCRSPFNLEVHHKIPLRHFPRWREHEANAVSNLITLCRQHHRVWERQVAHLAAHPARLPDDLDERLGEKLALLSTLNQIALRAEYRAVVTTPVAAEGDRPASSLPPKVVIPALKVSLIRRCLMHTLALMLTAVIYCAGVLTLVELILSLRSL